MQKSLGPLLSIIGEAVKYQSARDRSVGKVTWKLHSSEIAVIGEFTDSSGPFADDYFLVFLTKSSKQLRASFYSDGRDEVVAELGRHLGFEFRFGLCNSTELASRVIWPSILEGEPLFSFVPVEAKGIIQRLKQWAIEECEILLTADVQEEIDRSSA